MAKVTVKVPTLSGKQNAVASTIMNVLVNRGGLTKAGAAAVAGNWVQESALNPSEHGGLLAQWGGQRLVGEEHYAQSIGKAPTNAAAQARFALNELNAYPGLKKQLQTTNNAAKAAVAVSNIYERPDAALANNAARSRYASQIRQNSGVMGKIRTPGGKGYTLYTSSKTNRQISGGGVQTSTQQISAPQVTTTSTPDYLTAGVNTFLKAASNKIDVGSGKVSKAGTSTLANLQNEENYVAPITKTTVTPGKQVTTTNKLPTFENASTQTTAAAVQDTKGQSADTQKLFAMLHRVNGAPYSQANHNAVGETAKQIKASGGTDCSGLVSYLMGPNGLGLWSSSQTTPTITSAPGMQKGKGKVVTVYDNPQAGNAGHVFIGVRMKNGKMQYWASEGGVGVHTLSAGEVNTYLTQGSDGGHYVALHPKGL